MIGIVTGDCLDALPAMPADCVQTCVTSPPYFGLRDYGHADQIGLEATPDEFVAALVGVFREVRRVLRDDGTVWLNLGDSYNNRTKVRTTSHQPALNGFTDDQWRERAAAGGVRMSHSMGTKEKDLLGIPWMVAFALRADGWYLRADIIWHKPNPMPESVRDRPTKAHEYIFLLSKSKRYFYDVTAIREDGPEHSGRAGTFARNGAVSEHVLPGQGAAEHRADREDRVPAGRNKRSVWTIAPKPFPGAHFATFPPKLIEPCILAGCPERACGECGAPWERLVERTPMVVTPSSRVQTRDQVEARTATSGTMTQPPTSKTLGFQSSCGHDAPAVPGLVLDPFAGAGTTGVVAAQLGRAFVGIELKPEYAEMARTRIAKEGVPA